MTGVRSGVLSRVDPRDLVARFGSPLYVYDLDLLDTRIAQLRDALPAGTDIAFAVKANPSIAVLDAVRRAGLGVDVASGGEIAAVGRAGFPPDRVVVTGPGKRDEELARAVEAGVRAVTVESRSELRRLADIVRRRGGERPTPVLLRASATAAAPNEARPVIGGVPKFGMDVADVLAAARDVASEPRLRLLGVHAFGASNVTDAHALVAHARWTAALARDVAIEAGTPVVLVDVGGGLGIPYRDGAPELDIALLGEGLAELVAGWREDPWLRDARLLLEPGRYLAGPIGAYLVTVTDVKTVQGERIVVVDGGIHHLARPALVREPHRVRTITGAGRPAERVTVVGPLCTALDTLARGVHLPAPEQDDVLAVLDAGAYGYTESMPWFLSHRVPAEVAVRGARAELVRPAVDPSAWLDPQRIPTW